MKSRIFALCAAMSMLAVLPAKSQTLGGGVYLFSFALQNPGNVYFGADIDEDVNIFYLPSYAYDTGYNNDWTIANTWTDVTSGSWIFRIPEGQNYYETDFGRPVVVEDYITASNIRYGAFTIDSPSVPDPGVFSLTYIADAPEPADWALMLVGFGTLGAALRRKRNALPLGD